MVLKLENFDERSKMGLKPDKIKSILRQCRGITKVKVSEARGGMLPRIQVSLDNKMMASVRTINRIHRLNMEAWAKAAAESALPPIKISTQSVRGNYEKMSH